MAESELNVDSLISRLLEGTQRLVDHILKVFKLNLQSRRRCKIVIHCVLFENCTCWPKFLQTFHRHAQIIWNFRVLICCGLRRWKTKHEIDLQSSHLTNLKSFVIHGWKDGSCSQPCNAFTEIWRKLIAGRSGFLSAPWWNRSWSRFRIYGLAGTRTWLMNFLSSAKQCFVEGKMFLVTTNDESRRCLSPRICAFVQGLLCSQEFQMQRAELSSAFMCYWRRHKFV